VVGQGLKRAVFLDRDGVINESLIRQGKPIAPNSVRDLILLSGVTEAIRLLFNASFEVVVVTNQPDVSSGRLNWVTVDEIHQEIKRKTGLQHFYVCPHTDGDNCLCRKPKPGLILNSARELGIEVSLSYLVGDRWRDIEAGQSVGCKCFFIDNEYEEEQPSPPFFRVKSLLAAAKTIMRDIGEVHD